MGPKVLSANFACFVLYFWLIVCKMVFIAPQIFAAAVNVVIFVLFVLGLDMEIINVLRCQYHFFS
jgi:hypothetical protein